MNRTPKTQKGKTEKIFSILKTYGFHAQDVQYGNGYFIFEHGKDMVVHFHIKECKGWLFGIWWDLEDKNKFDFFAQFEATIDKFKPSASTYVEEKVEYCKNCEQEIKFYIKPMLEFIKKYPYVAWKYDNEFVYKIWDYTTPFESWKEYIKFTLKEKRLQRILNQVNKKWLKLTQKICEELCKNYEFSNYEIIDENIDGIRSYPRYFIIAENGEKGGCYSINLKDTLSTKLYHETLKFDNWLEKLNKKGYYIHEINPYGGYLNYGIRKNDKSRN